MYAMSEMSQFSIQFDGLARVPALLAEIEREIRNLTPPLNASAAATASAPVVATAMIELSASFTGFVEQNEAELHSDVEKFGQVIRNYQDADRTVVDSSQRLCRAVNAPTIISR
jgi:hypothetical protein